ncbi:Trypsin domain protein [Myxococcus hansupus]|uniref:Trypsin domain protein n=1 Tax=Pseudomyxococcus hansupus TaxID=1297742 RepID=A0A0H4X054_9BACT|nr:hypothetical protein [Myxococcus hansupus]AKQ67243.1 Trypsin domain protein [Myxococcus hansupus]
MHWLRTDTRARFVGALMGSLVLTTGCGPEESYLDGEEEVLMSTDKDKDGSRGRRQDALIYGHDSREDVYRHPDAHLRARAHQSTVAIMRPGDINASDPNNVSFNGGTLKNEANLCDTERFLNDPAASDCTGTLIDDDLVLTSGTCVVLGGDCENLRFVFNYYRDSPISYQRVTAQDVFQCAKVEVAKYGYWNGLAYNYAIIRLDRSATPRFTPAPVLPASAALDSNAPISIVGTSEGTPFKLDTNGTIRNGNPLTLDSFMAHTNTFWGQIGSAAYEPDTNTVVGMFTDGLADYTTNGACNVVNLCPNTGCPNVPVAEQYSYARPAIDEFCGVSTSRRLCGETTLANALTYSRANTQSALTNTAQATLSLVAGQTALIGTCGTPGSFASGDTVLRLYNAANTQVAVNDDTLGLGNRCSFIRYQVPTGASGDYTLRAGCYDDKACRATVTWSVGAASFSVANTQSATVNTSNHRVTLTEGQRLHVGTCGQPGATKVGDTFIRLFDPQGQEMAFNDDACGGTGSQIQYTVPAGKGGVWEVRAGCYSTGSCSGNLAWSTHGGTNTFVYETERTAGATVNTVNQDLALAAGQTLTVGTCGMANAYTPDDSLLRLMNAAGTQVTFNDDACGVASRITYVVPADGVYQLRAGCYGADACSGSVAYTTH